jgi:magnesium-protoporphyrin O-methyltransferase
MSGCCQGIDGVFGDKTAKRDLRRYRRRGPSRPTRLLLAALREAGVSGAALLDIGGGVGAIQHELLEAGAERATGVDASQAYLRAAREEAARRGNAGRVSQRLGDFVELAEEIAPADVVTLDRVICCYPDVEALVGRSAEHAQRLYGLVYPRDAWWTRLGVRFANLGLRVMRNPFRVFVHPDAVVGAVARSRGLEPRLRRGAGPVWQVAVFARPA